MQKERINFKILADKKTTHVLTFGLIKSERQLVKSKRSQVTIFIIIAIIIVALVILAYFLYPKIISSFGVGASTPEAFLQNCVEDETSKIVQQISLQGGSLEPKNYFLYENNQIEYLCYTNEYYLPCVMQQPVLQNHIENEIKNTIREKTNDCFNSLEKNYKGKGYEVSLIKGNFDVELLPKRIVLTFNNSLTLKKESTELHRQFRVVLNNNLYELVGITNSILNWEARYGDAETTAYMTYYHDLKVEKQKQTDGTTIYILTDRNTGNKFQFASRSFAWPPGYGTG